MGVGIDTAGHDQTATRVYDFSACWHLQVLANSHNLAAFTKYICTHTAICGHNGSASN
jgi:hypothetical protein